MKIPSSIAYGKSCVVRFNSPSEQSIPLLSTPRNLPFLIFLSPGRVAPSRATGTISPALILDAPVTI